MIKRLAGAVCTVILCLGASSASAQAPTPMDVGASSVLKGKAERYSAWRVVDADEESDDAMPGGYRHLTAWCEGKKDQGVGEYLELTGNDLSFTKLEIATGFWKTPKLWKANNRPTRLSVTVTAHDGSTSTFDVPVDIDGMQHATIDTGAKLQEAKSIKIAFAEVSKGKVNDTCISNVSIYNGDRKLVPFLEAGEAIQDLSVALTVLGEGFDACSGEKLAPHLSFPLSYKSVPSSETGKSIKKKWKKLKEVVKSCSKGETPSLSGDPSIEWIKIEAPGKIAVRAGSSNSSGMGPPIWHLTYELSVEHSGGVWKLTSADVGP